MATRKLKCASLISTLTAACSLITSSGLTGTATCSTLQAHFWTMAWRWLLVLSLPLQQPSLTLALPSWLSCKLKKKIFYTVTVIEVLWSAIWMWSLSALFQKMLHPSVNEFQAMPTEYSMCKTLHSSLCHIELEAKKLGSQGVLKT